MAPRKHFLSIVLFLCASVLLSGQHADGTDEPKVYIVHVKQPEGENFSAAEQWAPWYSSLLNRATGDTAASRIIYSYRNVMTGFSARLTDKEVEAMSKLDWFLHAYPSRVYRPLTTHTPMFLGLRYGGHNVWNATNMGEGIIIGVLDTGVTPGHPSYDDHDMPPAPAKWKGRCDLNATVCNNKLIGAMSFIDYNNPIDYDGHGTHTSTTAAGAFVKGANANGNAKGVASGMAPRAHIAAYKVCYGDECQGHDILAGMDAAVDDGVDVLSLSLGGDSEPYHSDPIAQGGFNAINRGVFVSCSAGNSGPDHSTLSNDAPWLLTVGASTMDRSLLATVKLGDGQEFDGETLYQPHDFGSKMLPLMYPNANEQSSLCVSGSLDRFDVRGKIVLCDRGQNSRIEKGQVVQFGGGAGMIVANAPADGYATVADPHVLPASNVPYAYGLKIKSYINSTASPTATIIFKGTAMNTPHSPAMASFSSRGPSQITPVILKPDITGPGVSVLAAWPDITGPGVNILAAWTSAFEVFSGTSMSCPHLSGVAALIKKAHPDWSPAAIKSAIMTTAYATDNSRGPILDERRLPADLFAVGAGHVDPPKAMDPGLVYDLTPQDYIPYLCGLYANNHVRAIVGGPVNCSSVKSISEAELNYPSISVKLPAIHSTPVSYTRTVTNVGAPRSTYRAMVDVPEGVSARVDPTTLSFEKVDEKKSFSITFRRRGGRRQGAVEGQLRWVSTKHVVRSPISIILE
ncbi:subtilisin-like protease [Musa troglodytarum]|uniref:Subtilisin-like protease n=1 Tax=Musa troglodytarum TaxID=320322 RepID=A0A9E7EJK8_9LILI|nr:subtilisin-like protease [Musa troglodytarum]